MGPFLFVNWSLFTDIAKSLDTPFLEVVQIIFSNEKAIL